MANDYAQTDYRDRDRLNGGTDSPWVKAADFNLWAEAIDTDADSVPDVIDMRADDDSRFSGVLSQADLSGPGGEGTVG